MIKDSFVTTVPWSGGTALERNTTQVVLWECNLPFSLVAFKRSAFSLSSSCSGSDRLERVYCFLEWLRIDDSSSQSNSLARELEEKGVGARQNQPKILCVYR